MRRSFVKLFVEYVPKRAIDAPSAAVLASRPKANSIHEATARFRETEAAASRSDDEIAQQGFFFLPKLKYGVEAGVAPVMSSKQFRYVYDVIHRDVVEQLNRFSIGSDVEGHTLETVIRQTSFDATRSAVHTPACEHFNYCFFYNSLRPWGTAVSPAFREVVALQFGGGEPPLNRIKKMFLRAASSLPSRTGWVYLVWTGVKLDVIAMEHGTTPLALDLTPLMCVSVHESTYGLDYSTVGYEGLEQYLENFFKACNWNQVARYLADATGKPSDPSF